MAPKLRKVIDCSDPEAPDSPVFDAGRDSKMDIEHQPDIEPTAPKSSGSPRLGLSKINDYRGQSEKPRRKRALDSVLKARAENKAALAGMVLDYQANHTGHKHVRRNLRKCQNEGCTNPIPYKKPLGTKHCSDRCKTAAARKRTDAIERDKVFQTAASIAQERSNAAQRFYNYCEVASEMQQSAIRIGRDDVIFFATPDGVIVANDGEPLPPIRVTVYAHELESRNVPIAQHGHNWSTGHPDVIDLLEAARIASPNDLPPASTVAPIPRSSWLDGRGTALEQLAAREAYLATLDDLLSWPERRVALYTIDDAAYLPVELGAALEQDSHWEFRFKGDPGTHGLDDYDYVEPDTTAEDIARHENRRKVLEWAKKHRNEPAYTHPNAPKDYFWLGRGDKELAFSDRRRIDPTPKHRPVEHLFEE